MFKKMKMHKYLVNNLLGTGDEIVDTSESAPISPDDE